MKIVIAGGTGQIGQLLARHYHQSGNEVLVLSRKTGATPWKQVPWDGKTIGPWIGELEGADILINLAGRSVNCRYHAQNRQEIMQSRVDTTLLLGSALTQLNRPPSLWLQAGTATIYRHRFDQANDERTGLIGGDEPGAPLEWNFSIAVAKAWERAWKQWSLPHTRKVCLRSAMVMGATEGGVFDTLLRLVRWGLGGSMGSGNQYVSWIHETDFVRALDWIVEHPDLSGEINLASPHPLPNREFMRELRRAWGQSYGLPATEFMLEIGARVLSTETELILKSRRVVPGRLLESGFLFDYAEWPGAARDLCKQWNQNQRKKKA